MKSDILDTIETLRSREDSIAFSIFGNQIQEFIRSGRIVIRDHMSWTNPILFNKLPIDLIEELNTSNLVIFKGDANYRRLILDTKWNPDTSFSEVTRYLNFPVVALRTLKAEICIGVDQKKRETAELEDKEWQQNGNWGVIQFANPTKK